MHVSVRGRVCVYEKAIVRVRERACECVHACVRTSKCVQPNICVSIDGSDGITSARD